MRNIIRKKRLKRLGHVCCMKKDGRANQILHWVPEGRKRRGRPLKNWTKTIKNDLKYQERGQRSWRCIARHADMHRMDYGLRSPIPWPGCNTPLPQKPT